MDTKKASGKNPGSLDFTVELAIGLEPTTCSLRMRIPMLEGNVDSWKSLVLSGFSRFAFGSHWQELIGDLPR